MLTTITGSRVSADARVASGAEDRRPHRIAFLLPTFDIGGAERVVLRTAAGLDRARFDPVVLAFRRGSGRLALELAEAGVDAVDLGVSSRRSPLAVVQLWQWLRQRPCDVLIAYMFHANLASRLVRPFAPVPHLVCSERIVQWESRWRLALNRATVRLTDVVTTNSAAGVAYWAQQLGVPESRIRLIYNGVDVSIFRPRPDAPPPSAEPAQSAEIVIGNLARLHSKNGQADLLAALHRLASMPSLPPWRCLIAGEGEEAATLADEARRLSLETRVEFVGHVAHPEQFLHGLDLYVQSSIAEGLPNAVLEAMASGLPVVATAVGGTPEAVQDGITGVLVPPGDAPRLADAMARLLRNSGERVSMGRAGRVRIEQVFSDDRMVHDTERLLDEMIGSGSTVQAVS